MRKQPVAQAVAGQVGHQRRVAAGEFFAAAGDVVERPFQPQQVFVVVRERCRGIAREIHPPQQLDMDVADKRRHALVEQLSLMLASGFGGGWAGRA